MEELKLDFLVINNNSVMTLTIFDISVYPDPITDPIIKIKVPGFEEVELDFVPETYNVFNSTTLGITTAGKEVPLPDGIYTIKYGVDNFDSTYVEHSILRVEKLQEKFDNAFLTLDMMECDRAIKKQSFVQLNSIYFFIQGAIAAANNCALVESKKLYQQASKMLDSFIAKDCGCSGNNYLINY